jgi:hypothetical protein
MIAPVAAFCHRIDDPRTSAAHRRARRCGHRHGSRFAILPGWGGESASIVELDADRFVASGGELTVMEQGQRLASADLLPASYTQPHQVTIHAASLDQDTLPALWCTPSLCHLTRICPRPHRARQRARVHVHRAIRSEGLPLPSCAR